MLYLDFLRDRETPHDVGPFGIPLHEMQGNSWARVLGARQGS